MYTTESKQISLQQHIRGTALDDVVFSPFRARRRNTFMTENEVYKVWRYLKEHCSEAFQMLYGAQIWRGVRISEACKLNIYEFQGEEWNKINIILSKSKVKDVHPLFSKYAEALQDYARRNLHRLRGGYLFPAYRGTDRPISPKYAETVFSNIRNKLTKTDPAFGDRDPIFYQKWKIARCLSQGYLGMKNIMHKCRIDSIHSYKGACRKLRTKGYVTFKDYEDIKLTESGAKYADTPDFYWRYRVGTHSLRRFFITKLKDSGLEWHKIDFIMRYLKMGTSQRYYSPYEVWRKEEQILEDVFGDVWHKFNHILPGQTKLQAFQ